MGDLWHVRVRERNSEMTLGLWTQSQEDKDTTSSEETLGSYLAKSTGCFYKGWGFDSQHPHDAPQSLGTIVLGYDALCGHYMYVVHRLYASQTAIHIK